MQKCFSNTNGKATSAFPSVLGALCHFSNCIIVFFVANAVLILLDSPATFDFADHKKFVHSLEQPSPFALHCFIFLFSLSSTHLPFVQTSLRDSCVLCVMLVALLGAGRETHLKLHLSIQLSEEKKYIYIYICYLFWF